MYKKGENNMRKNDIKAVIYAIVGIVTSMASFLGMICMYFSGTFLPVYVNDTYVVGNQIVRYELYAVLLVVGILTAILAAYGINFLSKKSHKNRRRR